MDGRGITIFGRIWAQNVAAVSEGRLTSESLGHEIIDRTRVFGNGSRVMELSDFSNYRMSKDAARCELQRQLLKAAIVGDISPEMFQLIQQLELSYWNVPLTGLQAAKDAAAAKYPEEGALTDSDVLSALLWRHITRARQLSRRGIESSCLLNVVNVRRRMDPPLSTDYPGNALAHAKTTAKTTDIESEMPLFELAKQIRESIEWWTSDRIWNFIGAVDSTAQIGRVYVQPKNSPQKCF